MRIRIVAVGARLPSWAEDGVADYLRRLPNELQVEVNAIKTPARHAGAKKAMADEAKQLLQRSADSDLRLALDERGTSWTSRELADQLKQWQLEHREVALLIGGPDGLAPEVIAACRTQWSLSRLTLPHALVRVLVAEQIYRASALLRGHPYHRD